MNNNVINDEFDKIMNDINNAAVIADDCIRQYNIWNKLRVSGSNPLINIKYRYKIYNILRYNVIFNISRVAWSIIKFNGKKLNMCKFNIKFGKRLMYFHDSKHIICLDDRKLFKISNIDKRERELVKQILFVIISHINTVIRLAKQLKYLTTPNAKCHIAILKQCDKIVTISNNVILLLIVSLESLD
jgi:hypothetical protein